ncbi:MAG TPA: carboxypeptidase-like regulatory domain-containing protein [Vicinamibacteria bacterium]|nr:carboxypeptidase-like regulatory domain-containing protein [Vicinamibacteria bacterium]
MIGVKCSSGCRLAGRAVRVLDDAGIRVGEVELGDAPWPGTHALYVGEILLRAPAVARVNHWSGSFGGDACHGSATAPFSFRTVRRAEHKLVIAVTERVAGTPVAGAAVFMGGHRATTDQRGVTALELPKGTYALVVRKPGYESHSRGLEVALDETVAISMDRIPQKNPDEGELWM